MSQWRILSQSLFGLLLFLLLASHAAENGGPFTWRPLPTAVSGQSWQIGVLALPVVVAAGWWLGHCPARFGVGGNGRNPPPGRHLPAHRAAPHPGDGAPGGDAGPGLVLSISSVNQPRWQADWLWRGRRPPFCWCKAAWPWPNFCSSGSWGWPGWANRTLDLLVEGTSVAQRDGQNWLRAYGLNSHPNQLGPAAHQPHFAGLAAAARAKEGLWRGLFWLALAAGFAGLLVSLSRSAWLARAWGGLVLAWPRGTAAARSWRELGGANGCFAGGSLAFCPATAT